MEELDKSTKELILKYTNKVKGWLNNQTVSSLSCDWTEDNSLFYQTKIKEYTIYLEMFFVNEDRDDLEDGVESVLNIYKEKECKLAYGGTLKDCLKQIDSLIK